MSEIDRQRVAAVKKLEEMGYRFSGGEWKACEAAAELVPVGDGVYRLMVTNAEALAQPSKFGREASDFLAWEWIGGNYAAPPVADAVFRLLVHRAMELAKSEDGSDERRELNAVARALDEFETEWELDGGWCLKTHAEIGGRGIMRTRLGFEPLNP